MNLSELKPNELPLLTSTTKDPPVSRLPGRQLLNRSSSNRLPQGSDGVSNVIMIVEADIDQAVPQLRQKDTCQVISNIRLQTATNTRDLGCLTWQRVSVAIVWGACGGLPRLDSNRVCAASVFKLAFDNNLLG